MLRGKLRGTFSYAYTSGGKRLFGVSIRRCRDNSRGIRSGIEKSSESTQSQRSYRPGERVGRNCTMSQRDIDLFFVTPRNMAGTAVECALSVRVLRRCFQRGRIVVIEAEYSREGFGRGLFRVSSSFSFDGTERLRGLRLTTAMRRRVELGSALPTSSISADWVGSESALAGLKKSVIFCWENLSSRAATRLCSQSG